MTSQGVQSLGLIVALLVPGGLFLWSYERKSSSYRRRDLKDRVVRLAAASVILLTITAPIAWYAYIQFWQGLISGGSEYTWMWHRWLAACGYLAAVVFIVGPLAATINQRLRSHLRLSGDEINRRQRLLRWVALKVLEVRPNPNAFEFLADNGPFIMRIETKSGKVLAGVFDDTESKEDPLYLSHASTDPQNRDIYLRDLILVTEDGKFVHNEDKTLSYGQGGLYIGADVIESAQIIRDYEGGSNGSDT